MQLSQNVPLNSTLVLSPSILLSSVLHSLNNLMVRDGGLNCIRYTTFFISKLPCICKHIFWSVHLPLLMWKKNVDKQRCSLCCAAWCSWLIGWREATDMSNVWITMAKMSKQRNTGKWNTSAIWPKCCFKMSTQNQTDVLAIVAIFKSGSLTCHIYVDLFVDFTNSF